MFLRLTTRQTAQCAASFTLLIFFTCAPAFAQTVPPDPDPLARIRAQPPAQACSAKEITLCDEAAPKIIANAMGSDSTIEANLRQLASGEGGHAMGAPAPQSAVDEVRVADWAVAAFRAAGLTVHVEPRGTTASADENIVAEIRGREKPDEIVILAAVIDPSALRDHPEVAADAAVLVEAARDIVATGLVPRRTIRFVLLFGGGIDVCGALDYVKAHSGELDRTIAVILVSQGTGRGTRYLLNGRQDIEPQVREAVQPLAGLALAPDSFDEAAGNCTMNFFAQGLPTLVAEPESQDNRTSPITLSQADFQELKRHAAIAGVTAFDVAEDVAPLGPRLSRADAETLMKQSESQ
jgi:hypothetical protein